ncbi:hypothetical protein PUNSTDRAFT_122751 [Punctularia strigosozonata HHB-11173 SS5]|uniref:LysM domain-containing protein n=1 Tax=Punctularia strigosozonata (strain HHB-11173) TaxID=741275 RepID=R7S4M3_PUNST|nr:uncharacterized protein PUNSTDRAFT_122751 [Punctularia strigosozonata HHB-11173 SS5]EIN04727.1 hypothetical protein PUNSTDRAFT_122751 [Punctularia strigosozonata HHB-11173 SS5]
MARFSALVAFVALGAAVGVTAQEPNCARNYTVQLGDTCNSIAAAQNVPTLQLEEVNADKIDADCSNLALGEPLCLGIIGQDCNVTHVVASGDTCSSIAGAAGIKFSLLLTNNPNIDDNCDNIGIGEVLCTANTTIVQ